MEIGSSTLLLGLVTGLTYAILAAGLVLIYRATKVINFAHGEVGALGAAILAKLVLDLNWSFIPALIVALGAGAGIGAAVELLVVRRLFHAPRLIVLVATIGVSQLVFVGRAVLPTIQNSAAYPSPINRTIEVGDLVLRSEHFMVFAVVPAVIAGLALFLGRTPFGVAIRAAADNADRAELAGIPTKRVSTAVWVLAGVLATLTVILLNPVRGVIVGLPAQAVGASLLLRALAAGLVGRLRSLPLALAGGMAIGIAEAIVKVNIEAPGVVELMLFVLVLVLVLRTGAFGGDEAGSWSLTPKVQAAPERLRALPWVRNLTRFAATGGLVIAAVLPFVLTTSSQTFLFTRVLLFALIALSVTVLIGWAGQLSLGQMAFVGLGGVCATALVARGMSFPVAVAYAAVAGAAAAIVVGFPALRVRGPLLAVTTLGFGVLAQTWLFRQRLFTGGSSSYQLPRSEIFGFVDLRSERTYYFMCLFVLVAAATAVARLRASGVGRTIIAVRENEAAASSFTVWPALAKLSAFAFSGALAGLAGALLAGAMVNFQLDSVTAPAVFGPEQSLSVVAMVVIGGLGSVGGAVLGAIYVVGLPALLGDSPTIGFATSGVGLLALLLYLPGGLMQLVYRARQVMLARAERALPPAAPGESGGVTVRPLPLRHETDEPADADALVARDVCVSFGGRQALQAVSLVAHQGEVVGLIGSNGAGKSTLLNVISGFVPAQSGTIELWGEDITHQPPHVRAHHVGRVFQDARLFGDLTLRETVRVALEPHERSEFVPSLLGVPPARRAERAKIAEAEIYIDFLGLGRYADAYLSDLSTGTRRIVEMACLLAQGSRLLLLDEPTAGVAQRETEAFGPLIKRIQRELGATILIVEHDIPLIMSISDRVYCLAAGAAIAEGDPEQVRHDPAVVAAYLGTDERAIARSGARAGVGR